MFRMTEPVHSPVVLSVKGLQAWYDESHVLHDITFDVREGEVVTLLGHNGAGKSTTLKSIMGVLSSRKGSVVLRGKEMISAQSRRIAREGMSYVPEHRGIFSNLTVEENLLLPPVIAPNPMSLDEIFKLFPNLKERLDSPGTRLSGGEQQMLSMARILRTGARLILLDEPTEGLAPVIIQQIDRVIRGLKERGYTVVLVEQNLHFAQSVADRHYIVEQGRVLDEIDSVTVKANPNCLKAYLGI